MDPFAAEVGNGEVATVVFAIGGRAGGSGGRVLVVDERAAGSLTAPGDQTGRLFAAASVTWCRSQSRGGPGPEPAGTLIRPAAMGDLARQAGYAGAGIAPAGHRAWRSGRLVP